MDFMKNSMDWHKFRDIEHHLSVPSLCGIQFAKRDIMDMAHSMGEKLPYRDVIILIKTLFMIAQEKDMLDELSKEFQSRLLKRADEYISITKAYPSTKVVLDGWISKAQASALLLHNAISK
jgi:hypothetical protein